MTDLARPEPRPLLELADALEKTQYSAAKSVKTIAALENWARRIDARLGQVRAILEEQECVGLIWAPEHGRQPTPTEKYLREQLQRLHLALEGL